MYHPSCMLVLSLSKHIAPVKLFGPKSHFLTLTRGNSHRTIFGFQIRVDFPTPSWHVQLPPHKRASWKLAMRRAHMNLSSCEYLVEKASTGKSWSSSSRQGARYSKAWHDSSHLEESVKMSVLDGNRWTILHTYMIFFLSSFYPWYFFLLSPCLCLILSSFFSLSISERKQSLSQVVAY